MLEKSITLNFSIMKDLELKIRFVLYGVWLLLFLCANGTPVTTMLIIEVVVIGLGAGISAGILIGIFRRVFCQSLFGDSAYTYMQFPFSSSDVVKGKLVAVFTQTLDTVMSYSILGIFLYFWWKDFCEGVVPWDLNFVETVVDDINYIVEVLFKRHFSSVTIAFFIGTFLIQLVLVCAMLCSGVQLGTILNHVHNRDGRKRYFPLLLMLAGIILFTGCLYLPTKVFAMVTGGFITVLPLLITMGLEIGLTIVGIRWSVKFLQTKYELN